MALFRLYQLLSSLALPFVARAAVAKLRKSDVPTDRAHERLGHATQKRHLGPLIWCHAASVGEAKSILPLIAQMTSSAPDLQVLLTSGTATSAKAIAPRLPANTLHQFAPLDGLGPMTRFLDHWRPNLCVLVESELWPNLLDNCARRDIPVALVNARLSDHSAQGWKRFPTTANYVLRGIRFAHCQDQRSRDHLRAMGLDFAQQGQNLKAMIYPRDLAPDTVQAAKSALSGRPLWVAASTHADEETGVLAAHSALLREHPNLCLILAPRHPERGQNVLDMIKDAGLTSSQRSAGGTLSDGAQVYLADTIGETDLWYAIAAIVFLGGSWTDAGGHSPFEAAAAQTAILHGPKYRNFSEVYAAFLMKDASMEVADSTALALAVSELLANPSRATQMAKNAHPLAQAGGDAASDLSDKLLSLARTKPVEHDG